MVSALEHNQPESSQLLSYIAHTKVCNLAIFLSFKTLIYLVCVCACFSSNPDEIFEMQTINWSSVAKHKLLSFKNQIFIQV